MPVRGIERLDSRACCFLSTTEGLPLQSTPWLRIAEFFLCKESLKESWICLKKVFPVSLPLMEEHHFESVQRLTCEMEASYAAGNVADWGH